MANNATGSAQQGGTEGGQGSLDTSQISEATLARLDEQAGGNLDKLVEGVRQQNAGGTQQ